MSLICSFVMVSSIFPLLSLILVETKSLSTGSGVEKARGSGKRRGDDIGKGSKRI